MKIYSKIILFICVLLSSKSLLSQLELKADGGSFEDVVPWGEGYIGIVQTQAYAAIPKFRQFQYFNEKGDMVWNKKITPFNFNNKSVCNPNANFAYYLNMPFSKTAALEKTSKTEFLNIHQIDKSGNVIEKSIGYTGVLKPLANHLKDLSQSYIAALNDGFIIVVTNDNSKYHVVKVDNKFDVQYQVFNFEWDEKKYLAGNLSKPIFVLGEDKLSILQLKLKENQIETEIKTVNFDSFTAPLTTINHIDFEGYSLTYTKNKEIEYSMKERQFVDHIREEWKGNTIYKIPTLGAFFNFIYLNGELISYSTFKNKESNSDKSENQGVVFFKLNEKVEMDAAKKQVLFVNSLAAAPNEQGIHFGVDNDIVFISSTGKNTYSLTNSLDKNLKFSDKESIAQVLALYITGNKLDEEIDVVSKTKSKYIGLDFDGFKNSRGNTKKVTIYTL